MDAIQAANSAFSVDLFKKLCELDKIANFIFTPLSISTSLALAYKAANGDTATQMKQGLHLEDVKDIPFGFQTITSDASKLSSFYSLKMVKRLYVEKSLNPNVEFINSVKRPFPSEFEVVDFKDKPEDTRLQINKSESVNDETKIILLNAAYFITNWMKKFPEAQTKECPFRISKTETKPVQMMNLEATLCLGYINDLKTKILELPCHNKHISMLILLPKDLEDDTTGLEQEITPEKLVQWTNPSVMANSRVNVFLPKFKVESEYDFKPILESLGMTHMFDENASDFSEMSELKGIVLSKIIHKVSLEVTEEGAESRDVPGYRILQHKDEFNADHPFLFFFKHNKSRSIVFAVMDLSLTRQSLSKAITAFALDLYNRLNSNKLCKNVFFSPASISTALGMVLIGAGGNSKMQIEKEGTIYSEFKQLLLQLNNLSHGYQLKLANNLKTPSTSQTKILLNKMHHLRMCFSYLLFSTLTEIFQQYLTRNIKELFAPGVIGPQTVLVLANAIYFKATWRHQFDPKYTTERNFRLNENETKPVHMMYQQGRFKLGHTDGKSAQILCLPYVDELLSMIIILPNDISQLEQVEAALTCKNLASWLSPGNLRERPVEIYIPRFKLEAGYDLNLTLQGLGLIDVFSEAKADLLGMSPSPQLFLSTVVHKAYVDINEVGTEAAAATGVAVSNRSLEHHELFVADHPFLFCILHNATDTVLFLGKLCCP
ncbi:Serpin B5, partial [Ophiophagus hannah]